MQHMPQDNIYSLYNLSSLSSNVLNLIKYGVKSVLLWFTIVWIHSGKYKYLRVLRSFYKPLDDLESASNETQTWT